MPRTARTDPYDGPCWVKDCDNVGGKYGLCRTHYRQASPLHESIPRMVEQMTVLHNLRLRHARQVRRLARKAGLTLVKKPSYAEAERLEGASRASSAAP